MVQVAHTDYADDDVGEKSEFVCPGSTACTSILRGQTVTYRFKTTEFGYRDQELFWEIRNIWSTSNSMYINPFGDFFTLPSTRTGNGTLTDVPDTNSNAQYFDVNVSIANNAADGEKQFALVVWVDSLDFDTESPFDKELVPNTYIAMKQITIQPESTTTLTSTATATETATLTSTATATETATLTSTATATETTTLTSTATATETATLTSTATATETTTLTSTATATETTAATSTVPTAVPPTTAVTVPPTTVPPTTVPPPKKELTAVDVFAISFGGSFVLFAVVIGGIKCKLHALSNTYMIVGNDA